MFNRNEKTVKKLQAILNDNIVHYEKEIKEFRITTFEEISQKESRKIERLGLRVSSIKHSQTGLLALSFKRKSRRSGIIITVLSCQVLLFGLQILYLASKTILP